MKITKSELMNQLEHTKNNFILGLAAYSLFDTGRSYSLLETHMAAFGPYTVTFDQVANLLRNKKDRTLALNEFAKMLLRTFIKEAFEHIKDYCEKTNQYPTFKSEPWYEFARLIRNYLSHNCRFEFNKYDKERLPVEWNGKLINVDMDKKTLDTSFFSYVEAWELYQEFENFVKKKLNDR